jgi:hypothetical protein
MANPSPPTKSTQSAAAPSAPVIFPVVDLASPTLSAELEQALTQKLAGGASGAIATLPDVPATLIAQGAALAKAHGLTGAGEVILSALQVTVRNATHAVGQPLDTTATTARENARAAAARAAARKKVVEAVKSTASAVASKVGAMLGVAKPRPPAPTPSARPAPPATSRTVTPPRKL